MAPTGEIALAFLQSLHHLGADMRVRNSDSQCVGMILAEMHGNGPWVDWIVSEAGCDVTAVSSEGLTIQEYVTLWNYCEGKTFIQADEHDEEWDSSSSSTSSSDVHCCMGGLGAIKEEEEEEEDYSEDDCDGIQEAD